MMILRAMLATLRLLARSNRLPAYAPIRSGRVRRRR